MKKEIQNEASVAHVSDVATAAAEADFEKKPLRLNYPITIKVGFAFAIIMMFWNAYDFVIPLLLEHAYGLSNMMRGLIMGLDNLLSLFLLPLFGKLSDRSKGKLSQKFGRRTPYIIVGTVVSVILMVFVPVSAQKQLENSGRVRAEYVAQYNDDAFMNEKLTMFFDKANEGISKYADMNFLKLNNVSKEQFVALRYDSKLQFKKDVYKYDGVEVEATTIVNVEKNKTAEEVKADNAAFDKYVKAGMNEWISEQVNAKADKISLVVYMIILLFTLIAMATFRSPAVALMPDVTPKPLRSQANAMINLVGGVGGALSFLIYTIILFGNSVYNYVIIFGAVGAGMIVLLICFLLLVKERKLVKRCEDICLEYGITDEDTEKQELKKLAEGQSENKFEAKFNEKYANLSQEDRKVKLAKAKNLSFLLILASIFMWFMGYNAVSSNLSVYCVKSLNLQPGIASIISGVSMGFSAIAFIPVGMLAVKIGRRKSIMLGFALAALSFVLLYTPMVMSAGADFWKATLFAAFYLIAGFGLIIANVNTFPMVVELAKAEDVGKYTGFYYTATMSAQAITPFIAGAIMDRFGNTSMFLYSAICVVIGIAIMFFVRYGDSMQIPKGKKMSKEEKKQVMLDSIGDAD